MRLLQALLSLYGVMNMDGGCCFNQMFIHVCQNDVNLQMAFGKHTSIEHERFQ